MSDKLYIQLTEFKVKTNGVEQEWIRAEIILNGEVVETAETNLRRDKDHYMISRGTVINMVKNRFRYHLNDIRGEVPVAR